LTDVFDRLKQAFISTQNMVEGFVLPYGATSAWQDVDASGRRAFDGAENLGEREGPAFSIGPRCEQKMSMIGHDYCSMKRDCDGVVVQAMLQYDSSSFWRELLRFAGPECDEQWAIVFLVVR